MALPRELLYLFVNVRMEVCSLPQSQEITQAVYMGSENKLNQVCIFINTSFFFKYLALTWNMKLSLVNCGLNWTTKI